MNCRHFRKIAERSRISATMTTPGVGNKISRHVCSGRRAEYLAARYGKTLMPRGCYLL
jgi:hypothetical protein